MLHKPTITMELRELAPTPEGWCRFEQTDRACAVCPCGTTTGFAPTAEAARVYAEHTNT